MDYTLGQDQLCSSACAAVGLQGDGRLPTETDESQGHPGPTPTATAGTSAAVNKRAEDVAAGEGNEQRCAESAEGPPRKRLRADAARGATGKRSLVALQAALRAKLLLGLHPVFPAPGLPGDPAPPAIATRAAAAAESAAAAPAAGSAATAAAAAAAALAAVAAAVEAEHGGASGQREAAGTEGGGGSELRGEPPLLGACAAVTPSTVMVSIGGSGGGVGDPVGPLTAQAPPPMPGPGSGTSGAPPAVAVAEVKAVASGRPAAAADPAPPPAAAVGPGGGAAALMEACWEAMERYAPRGAAAGSPGAGVGAEVGRGSEREPPVTTSSISSDDDSGGGGGGGGGGSWRYDELLLELLAGAEGQGRQGAGADGESSDAETAEEEEGAAVGDDAKWDGPAGADAENTAQVEAPSPPPPPSAAALQAHLDRVAASLVRRHCTVPVNDPLVEAYGGASRDAVQL